MSDFGTAQRIDTDPVGAALTATHRALFDLRATDRREARRLTDRLEQIAAQHSAGILSEADTVHALAALVDRARPQHTS
jgi:hypothetical protein